MSTTETLTAPVKEVSHPAERKAVATAAEQAFMSAAQVAGVDLKGANAFGVNLVGTRGDESVTITLRKGESMTRQGESDIEMEVAGTGLDRVQDRTTYRVGEKDGKIDFEHLTLTESTTERHGAPGGAVSLAQETTTIFFPEVENGGDLQVRARLGSRSSDIAPGLEATVNYDLKSAQHDPRRSQFEPLPQGREALRVKVSGSESPHDIHNASVYLDRPLSGTQERETLIVAWHGPDHDKLNVSAPGSKRSEYSAISHPPFHAFFEPAQGLIRGATGKFVEGDKIVVGYNDRMAQVADGEPATGVVQLMRLPLSRTVDGLLKPLESVAVTGIAPAPAPAEAA